MARHREALIDDLGNTCCPKCGEHLRPHTIDYGVADDNVHLYFVRECGNDTRHGKYVIYTDSGNTYWFNSESIAYKLIYNKEDNKVINKKAMNKKTQEVLDIKVTDNGTYILVNADGTDGDEMTGKAFFKEFKLVNAEMTKEQRDAAARPDKTGTKKVTTDKKDAGKLNKEDKEIKEPEAPEYDYQPVIENNRAGKPILVVTYKLDDTTNIVTKENTAGSIYDVALTRDLGEDETVAIPAKTKMVKVVTGQDADGKDIIETKEEVIEAARTETRRKVQSIVSKKGSIEEVAKGFIATMGLTPEVGAEQVKNMLSAIRQTRKCMKALPEIVEFYTK